MTKTVFQEVEVEVVKPLPVQITSRIPYPPPLGQEFTIEDLIDRLFTMYDLLDKANSDRASAKEISSP